MNRTQSNWQIYRTRFLVKATQLAEPMSFVDALGREHRGQKGDYLVESSDGVQRIAPRQIFEDIYVPMEPVRSVNAALPGRALQTPSVSRGSPRPVLIA